MPYIDGERFNKRKLALILKKAALNDDLKAKEYKVLLFLLPELRNGDVISVSQAEIARQTGLSPSQVSKAMRNLYEEDFIDYDRGCTSWRKQIRLVVDSFDKLEDEIDELISENTDMFYLVDDDDDDE